MKVHPDGTIEGHPLEIQYYIRNTPGSLHGKKYIIQNSPFRKMECNLGKKTAYN